APHELAEAGKDFERACDLAIPNSCSHWWRSSRGMAPSFNRRATGRRGKLFRAGIALPCRKRGAEGLCTGGETLPAILRRGLAAWLRRVTRRAAGWMPTLCRLPAISRRPAGEESRPVVSPPGRFIGEGTKRRSRGNGFNRHAISACAPPSPPRPI